LSVATIAGDQRCSPLANWFGNQAAFPVQARRIALNSGAVHLESPMSQYETPYRRGMTCKCRS
jgi:hypothetical protein